MTQNRLLLLVISFLEGGALMATELISSKLVAPFYGTSLYVWASVFAVTLIGLATGYFVGGRLSEKKSIRFFKRTLLASAILLLVMPFFGKLVMGITSAYLPFEFGIFASVLLFLFPSLFCFGMVSPFVVEFLGRQKTGAAGGNAGLVYGVSTFGGVLGTFLFGFYLLPFLGVMMSCFIVSIVLILSFFISLILKNE